MKRYIKIWNYNKFNRLRLFYRENKYKKKKIGLLKEKEMIKSKRDMKCFYKFIISKNKFL